MLKDEEEKEHASLSGTKRQHMSVCYRQHRGHYRKDLVKKLLAYYEEIGVEGTSFAPYYRW